jgi:hypothetical protein
MEWLCQCTGPSSCLGGGGGRGSRVLDADHITGSVSHGSSWDCAPAHGTGLFSGRFVPAPPFYPLYLFGTIRLFGQGAHFFLFSFFLGGFFSLIMFFGEIFHLGAKK